MLCFFSDQPAEDMTVRSGEVALLVTGVYCPPGCQGALQASLKEFAGDAGSVTLVDQSARTSTRKFAVRSIT